MRESILAFQQAFRRSVDNQLLAYEREVVEAFRREVERNPEVWSKFENLPPEVQVEVLEGMLEFVMREVYPKTALAKLEREIRKVEEEVREVKEEVRVEAKENRKVVDEKFNEVVRALRSLEKVEEDEIEVLKYVGDGVRSLRRELREAEEKLHEKLDHKFHLIEKRLNIEDPFKPKSYLEAVEEVVKWERAVKGLDPRL